MCCFCPHNFLVDQRKERRRRRNVINVGALVTKRKTYSKDDDGRWKRGDTKISS